MDIAKVRAFLLDKEEKRKQTLHARWLEARADFERIAAHIIAAYRPARVYQWGSLLDFRKFSEISDIDIALEGITGAEEFQALLGDVMDMSLFPIDIVRMENLDPDTAELIRRQGRLIHERADS
jgi:hypothetical protein